MTLSNDVVLSVKDLEIVVKNEGRVLVKRVSFFLEKSRVLGLVGESGCGKSLTCLSILGLLPTNLQKVKGEININGMNLEDVAAERYRVFRGKSVSMILQNPMSCFDPVYTIRSHFKETLVSHGLNDTDHGMRKAEEALRAVGFSDAKEILNLYPFQMSGGMLQRVMIALALSLEAPILIADEPTTDLDVASQARILDLIALMRKRRRLSILLVTHDLSVIARLADDVAVMRQGEIVERGTVVDIFHHPKHPYTRALLRAHFGLYQPYLESLGVINEEGRGGEPKY